VFNPIHPVTGVETGALNKRVQKRARSSTLKIVATSEQSSSKKVMLSNDDTYTIGWLKATKLVNLQDLVTWAKQNFRFQMVTIEPHLCGEEKLVQVISVYEKAQTELKKLPEKGFSASPFIYNVS